MDSNAALPDTYTIWLGALQSTYRELVEAMGALVPNLISALLVLFIGWLVAWILRVLILRLGKGFDRLFELAKHRTGQRSVKLRWPLSQIVAHSVFWLVVLFFLTAAATVLGLPGVAELFGDMLLYVPVLLFTSAVLFIVYLASGFVGDLTETSAARAGVGNPAGLGYLVRFSILALALIIAMGHLGINTALLINIVTVTAAMGLGGAALAFGIGTAGEVRNIVASRFARRYYSVGQRVRFGDVEGEITEITRTAITIDAKDGRTLVPARVLSETVTVLLSEDDHRA